METLSVAESLNPLPIDVQVAHAWATLRLALRDAGKRMPVNDSWITATAIANGMPVVSQDGDYDDVPDSRSSESDPGSQSDSSIEFMSSVSAPDGTLFEPLWVIDGIRVCRRHRVRRNAIHCGHGECDLGEAR